MRSIISCDISAQIILYPDRFYRIRELRMRNGASGSKRGSGMRWYLPSHWFRFRFLPSYKNKFSGQSFPDWELYRYQLRTGARAENMANRMLSISCVEASFMRIILISKYRRKTAAKAVRSNWFVLGMTFELTELTIKMRINVTHQVRFLNTVSQCHRHQTYKRPNIWREGMQCAWMDNVESNCV